MTSATSATGTPREINVLKESDAGRREEGGGEAAASSSTSSSEKIRTRILTPRVWGCVSLQAHDGRHRSPSRFTGLWGRRGGRGFAQGCSRDGRHQPLQPRGARARAAFVRPLARPAPSRETRRRRPWPEERARAETAAPQPPELGPRLSQAEASLLSQGRTAACQELTY